jgi:hypothetical protein
VVPHDLETYFSVTVALSGTLIGLLFVSITLRSEEIFGRARQRATATSAFISLVDALVISLWALLPAVNLGYPAAIAGATGLVVTFRTHVGPQGRRETSTALFAFSVIGQSAQVVVAILLVVRPHDRGLVEGLTYAVLYAVTVGLLRAWQLLVPDRWAKRAAPGHDDAPGDLAQGRS